VAKWLPMRQLRLSAELHKSNNYFFIYVFNIRKHRHKT